MIYLLLGSFVFFGLFCGGVYARWKFHEEAKADQLLRDRLRLQQAAVHWPPKDQGEHSTPWRNRRVS